MCVCVCVCVRLRARVRACVCVCANKPVFLAPAVYELKERKRLKREEREKGGGGGGGGRTYMTFRNRKRGWWKKTENSIQTTPTKDKIGVCGGEPGGGGCKQTLQTV